MTKIQPPTNCPSCNSEVTWINDQIYCRNTECSSKVEKKIEHFAKSLKIKGLGPATISKLNLSGIEDLYLLTKENITEALSSEKLAEKLIFELENSKRASLNLLLPGFSIPLVGKTAAEKLATVCDSVYDITDLTCRAAGLGPKVTENLLRWKKLEFPLLENLPFNFKFDITQQPEACIEVCISGKLKSYKTKADAAKALAERGFLVKDTLTKGVKILINESGIESEKTRRARESGVTILTNIKELFGE
jgi:DNA ligase (NAD+)